MPADDAGAPLEQTSAPRTAVPEQVPHLGTATAADVPWGAYEVHPQADRVFLVALSLLGGLYVVLIVAMLAADLFFTTPGHLLESLRSEKIRYAIKLSLFSCTASAWLSMAVAIPLGYLLSRVEFRGKVLLDTILDIPIVLPPLVLGLSLLILFQTPYFRWFHENVMPVTFAVPSVILAQFSVAAAFAVRTMRVTFDQIPRRAEQVALTLGCNRWQAFSLVVLPEARRGLLTAVTLSWARSLGEFGPILIFSGATRMKTEVLSTSVFLELSTGNLEAAIAVSLLMVAVAIVVLVITRLFGLRGTGLV